MPPLSAEQLAVRAKGIGSSEIAAILGESPWEGALDVWLAKTGRVEKQENDQMRFGRRAEALIAEEFAERFGVELALCGTTVSAEHPIAVATPDRQIVGSDPVVLVECKNVGWRVLGRWRADGGTFRVPPYVILQGQWQCGVVGADGFHVAAWLGGRDWLDDFFRFDPELFGDLVTVADRFWRDHVERDVQPAPDDTDRARKTLERLFPTAGGRILPATDEVTTLARQYAQAAGAEKEAKRQKLAHGNQLRALIGDAEGFAGDWGEVTWRAKSGRVAWAKLAKELEAPAVLIAKHTSAPTRTLKVKVQGLEDDDGDE